jgi:hypothetical protein
MHAMHALSQLSYGPKREDGSYLFSSRLSREFA